MVKSNANVIKIESLKHKAGDDFFEPIENWIITQRKRGEKAANPVNYI